MDRGSVEATTLALTSRGLWEMLQRGWTLNDEGVHADQGELFKREYERAARLQPCLNKRPLQFWIINL